MSYLRLTCVIHTHVLPVSYLCLTYVVATFDLCFVVCCDAQKRGQTEPQTAIGKSREIHSILLWQYMYQMAVTFNLWKKKIQESVNGE